MTFSKNLLFKITSAAAFAALFLFSDSSFAQKQPSWFPKVSCREAWGNRDRARFDFQADSKQVAGKGNAGYGAYQARLKSTGVDRKSCFKDWTVLVYMAADNDLSPYALWDLHEMEGSFASGQYAGSTLKSDLIVQADTAGRTGIRRLHMFQTPGADYKAPMGKEQFENAKPENVRSPLVQFFNEPKAASSEDHKQRLEQFLDWGMREYPASKYFVVVWGHGQGWASDPTAKSDFTGRFGGLAFSETPGDYLSVPALSRILSSTVQLTLENTRPIDVYAADACLMQMTEVATEIADNTRYIVGSAQIQTFLGLPYRQLMYEMNSGRFNGTSATVGRDDEAFLLAKMIPKLSEGALDPRRGQQGRADKKAARTFTMSSLSSAELKGQLNPNLNLLGRALVQYINEDSLRAMDLEALIQKTPSFMGGSKEAGSFLGLLEIQILEEARNLGELTPGAKAVQQGILATREALRKTSIEYGFGTDYREKAQQLHMLGFKSVGLWLPQTRNEYDQRIEDFKKSRFYRSSTNWDAWLKLVHAP